MQEIHKNLEKLLQQKDEQLRQFVESQSVADPSPTEIQILMEKLEKANQKIFEALNQNTKLKNELKVAQKCLQQEIGENFTIAQIMSGHSNWRGRAQQIAMLQSKIAIMKDKLETTSLESDGGSRLSLKRSESMRRLEAESLTKDLEECKMQIEEFRQKVLALKTRNKNLSDEANNYKLKTLELLEKSEHDEEFIKCLNEQISVVKFECKHKLDEMKLDVKQVEKMRQDAEFEAEKLSCELQNHDASLQEKIAEISNLRSTINQLESNLRDISGDFLFSCRDMSKEKYLTLLKNLENEKRELLSFLKDLNERLSSESIKTSNQHDVISKQRLKIVRLESKLKEMENEKEASKTKNRRVIRINEYSRTLSGSNIHCQHRPITRSNQMTVEIDKIKFKYDDKIFYSDSISISFEVKLFLDWSSPLIALHSLR